jgi:hypothetical protein
MMEDSEGNNSNLADRPGMRLPALPGMWAKVEPAELKAKYEIEYALKNGTRGWTMDHITLPVGSVVEFAGLKTGWMGQGELPPGVQMKPSAATYKSVESHRKSSMTFEKGKAGLHPRRSRWRALGDAGILGHRRQDNHLRVLERPGREAQDARRLEISCRYPG